jgi:serine/threonine protein kinase
VTVLYSATDEKWKITDFGFASAAASSLLLSSSSSRGKPSYRAPELLQPGRGKYGKPSDIWALGCILFEMITGRKRFDSDWEVIEYVRHPVARPQIEPVETMLLFSLFPNFLKAIMLVVHQQQDSLG